MMQLIKQHNGVVKQDEPIHFMNKFIYGITTGKKPSKLSK